MPTRKEVLENQTFKDQCDGLGQRVYYTLADHDRKFIEHRTAKVVAGLIELLRDKSILTEDEIDELLLYAIN